MAPRYLPAISSMSLGRAWNHDMKTKLAAATSHHIRGIEIFYEDLEYYARSLSPSTPSDSQMPSSCLIMAATSIRNLCIPYSLTINCLQPFMQFGGLLDRAHHSDRIREMRLWIQLAHALGTDLISLPSSILPPSQCTSNTSLIVSDMREISSIGLSANPPIRFSYESLCWGTWHSTWEDSWEIVKEVDRPNFGLCLDTFNIAGKVWADPTSPTGKTPNADQDLEASLRRLRTEVPTDKIFYVQVVDAERLHSPLVKGHEWYQADQPARMSWSRNARLFPFEQSRGGYLPIPKILDAIIYGAGYQGYISFELFNRSMSEKGEEVIEDHASRAEESWNTLSNAMGWNQTESIPNTNDNLSLENNELDQEHPQRPATKWLQEARIAPTSEGKSVVAFVQEVVTIENEHDSSARL